MSRRFSARARIVASRFAVEDASSAADSIALRSDDFWSCSISASALETVDLTDFSPSVLAFSIVSFDLFRMMSLTWFASYSSGFL